MVLTFHISWNLGLQINCPSCVCEDERISVKLPQKHAFSGFRHHSGPGVVVQGRESHLGHNYHLFLNENLMKIEIITLFADILQNYKLGIYLQGSQISRKKKCFQEFSTCSCAAMQVCRYTAVQHFPPKFGRIKFGLEKKFGFSDYPVI
jgi:hypothetical protein